MSKHVINNLSDEELIAYFLGYTEKYEVIMYFYYHDFRSDYEKETIYTNREPKWEENPIISGDLVSYKLFDPCEQEPGFLWETLLNYKNSWSNLMKAVDRVNKSITDDATALILQHLIHETVKYVNIKECFETVVKYIKWYYNK